MAVLFCARKIAPVAVETRHLATDPRDLRSQGSGVGKCCDVCIRGEVRRWRCELDQRREEAGLS